MPAVPRQRAICPPGLRDALPARHRIVLIAIATGLLAPASRAAAQPLSGPARTSSVTLSAPQLLALADAAAKRNDLATAEAAYAALMADTSVQVRSEARFRLAAIRIEQHRLKDAAVLLREILDEQPNAQPVRLELARVLDLMGDGVGARRALREAQAGGLPREVAQIVDRYSAALRAQKPFGGNVELAIAPDSNVNRATRSQTLSTVLGEVALDENAQQRGGVGLALRGQAYARLRVGERVNLFGRISNSADVYRDSMFNDVRLAATAGPELRSGADRFSAEAGMIWRWYGGRLYSRAPTLSLNYSHPLGRTAQLRASADIAAVDNIVNSLLDGTTWSLSLAYERALSARSGVGLALRVDRQGARNPAYATRGGQLTIFGYREIGPATLVATLIHARLGADGRLALLPARRSDRLHGASLSATFRNLRVGTLAPLLRISYERNRSSLEIYDYRKLRAEIGLSRSF